MAAKIKSPTLPSLEFFDTYSHYKQKLCHRKTDKDKNLTETNKNKSSWPENSNMKLMKSKAIQNMASMAHKSNKSYENKSQNNNTRRHSIAGCHDDKLESNEMIDEDRDRDRGRGGIEKSPGVLNRTNLSYSKPNTRIGFRNTANRRRRSVANRSNSFFTSRNSINHFYQEIKGLLGFYRLRIEFFFPHPVSKPSHQKLHRQN